MKEIKLTKGFVALVDDADYEWLNQWKWCAAATKRLWYAIRLDSVTQKKVKMHRVIMQAPAGLHVDHRDANGLNNQRHNLRLATALQNLANRRTFEHSSIYKGVHWDAERNKWFAQINFNYKKFALGRFDSEVEAALAYDAKARELSGDFARLNFPQQTATA